MQYHDFSLAEFFTKFHLISNCHRDCVREKEILTGPDMTRSELYTWSVLLSSHTQTSLKAMILC
jgi:hypothetical protein